VTHKQKRIDTRPRFTEREMILLTQQLNGIAEFAPIAWEFREDDLVVDGLEKERIFFTQFARARAFLDGLELGYRLGYKNGLDEPFEEDVPYPA
jgi:hypothetical protein